MNKFIFFVGLGFSIGLCSCGTAPPAYIPNKMHVPLFNEQGQIYAEGSFTDPKTNDFSAAVCILPHISLIGAMSFNHDTFDSSIMNSSSSGFGSKYFEIGAGYFWQIRDRGILELFGMFGKGKVLSQGFNTIDKPLTFNFFGHPIMDTFMYVNAEYNRYSLEAHFGTSSIPLSDRMETKFYYESALCLRLSFLYFIHLTEHRDYYGGDPLYPGASTPSNITNWKSYEFFPEIAILGRINYSIIALEAEFGITMAGNRSFDAPTTFASATLFFKL